ncbi:cytochrome P450 [Kroppenstedtia pulmonis]|uniref:Cytochrome P450 n=1 Tax=Kroppenstedtia pulmonis TaxID=1380685 RepID=A0A7D3XMP7_9BACL|nr:cytochrome P450 [Kroppenstedtia pulmonis]QKG84489.1 cytochrome P450 [Kroppenstedtia pulmonis]
MEVQVDFFQPNFKNDAYQVYTQLRSEDPVHRVTLPDGQTAWMVMDYENALAVLKDDRLIKDPTKLLDQEELKRMMPVKEREIFTHHMLSSDPPDHSRLRSLVHKAFTPRMVEQLEGRIEQIANQLLEGFVHRGQVDLITEYAYPLPIIIICEMLGIPERDHDQFREWTSAIFDSSNNPEKMKEAQENTRAFIRYLQVLIEERRQDPSDDLISALVHAEEEGDMLTEKELYATISLLIIAGHETTVNLIGNGVRALLESPDQLEKLKRAPELAPSAVEEILRYYSPVEVSSNRWASESFMLQGRKINKGDRVLAVVASANRDETRFENPDRFDITRRDNRHLTFGMGIHFCLGAPLARLEGRIALNALLHHLPNMKLQGEFDSLQWRDSFFNRGLIKLPIVW